jgi:D-alanyl-D-alanine carboxypeptidase
MRGRCGTLLRAFTGHASLARLRVAAVAGLLVGGLIAGSAAAAPSAAIVVDVKTAKVLFSSNADAQRYPASLTKMMTLYLLFEAIEGGKIRLDSRIEMSAYAASQSPTKLGVKPGQTISVRDAILALITKSANDVAVAIAERVAGSEKEFAQRMTARARELGMSRTTFRNASGLPDESQVTTARDLATLGRALQDHFPQYYSYFSTPSFVWHGRRIANHNRLLGRIPGVNGIKTGYTRASGYNLVTSVDRDSRKIVAVVLGGDTGKARDQRMASLIDAYLPLASRGSRTAAIVPGGPAVETVANVELRVTRHAYPTPRLRPADDSGGATMASVADVTTASVPDVAGANSIFALDANAQEGDTATGDETADAPALTPGGWKIQIAASPSQQSAEELLDRALAKAGKVLANASPYTEPVRSGATTLYRARFAGFRNQDAARSACAYLASQKFNCLAISN